MLDYVVFLLMIAMFLASPLIFIITTILAVIHIRKYKKGLESKANAVIFSLVSAGMLTNVIAETLIVIWFAQGLAHM